MTNITWFQYFCYDGGLPEGSIRSPHWWRTVREPSAPPANHGQTAHSRSGSKTG